MSVSERLKEERSTEEMVRRMCCDVTIRFVVESRFLSEEDL